jgi:hypothetical protein
MFFFEKKNQKTFDCRVTRRAQRVSSGDQGVGGKFFGSFFSKHFFLPDRKTVVG